MIMHVMFKQVLCAWCLAEVLEEVFFQCNCCHVKTPYGAILKIIHNHVNCKACDCCLSWHSGRTRRPRLQGCGFFLGVFAIIGIFLRAKLQTSRSRAERNWLISHSRLVVSCESNYITRSTLVPTYVCPKLDSPKLRSQLLLISNMVRANTVLAVTMPRLIGSWAQNFFGSLL